MRHTLRFTALALAGLFAASPAALAVIPYSPVSPIGPPIIGPGLSPPDAVYGKEYSHDRDFSVAGPVADAQQVIAWDGAGGTADTVDFTGTREGWEEDQQIDAIANARDALFSETLRDASHLIFSHDDFVAGYISPGVPVAQPIPSGGPIGLANGNVINGAGEVSVELGAAVTGPNLQFGWASQPEVNAMPLPVDVDGLEVWGPEPRENNQEPGAPVVGDVNKYSLDVDWPSGVSVWNGAGSAYIGWPTIVTAVESLLGPIPGSAFDFREGNQGRQAINLDALMVNDTVGRPDVFDQDITFPGDEPVRDQNGEPIDLIDPNGEFGGDQIVFSIRQIVDPEDPDGYYATGSELIVLDSLAGPSGAVWLEHGGHEWSHDYSLSELSIAGFQGQEVEYAVIDINGIEAIGEKVEEPPTFCPGDFNGDGRVDNDDLNLLLSNWGAAVPPAPAGWGGFAPTGPLVDNDELNSLLNNWGKGTSTAPVPEPSTMVLATLAGVTLLRRRAA
ncbi:MAG: PEP-CTERM sorting domain-containing protein [Planctomycetota bacterium]